MKAYWLQIYEGCKSLLIGLKITLGYLFQPVVTVQYPHQSIKMPARFRGHILLVADEQGNDKCIACGICQRNCPSGCITISGEKLEGAKKKSLTSYRLDFTKCSLCGICVESCPTDALDFSKEYNVVGFKREDFIFDLKTRFEEAKR